MKASQIGTNGVRIKSHECLRILTMKGTQNKEIIYKELSYKLQGAIFEIHNELGPSFKESAYENALTVELRKRGIPYETQKKIAIKYKGIRVGVYVPDVIVDEKILVELKAKAQLTLIDKNQFYYYMKGSKYRLGYLINFGTPRKVEIIRSVWDTPINKQST